LASQRSPDEQFHVTGFTYTSAVCRVSGGYGPNRDGKTRALNRVGWQIGGMSRALALAPDKIAPSNGSVRRDGSPLARNRLDNPQQQ